MGPVVPNATAVRALYKQLARYGQELVLTDQKWFSQRLRFEFTKPRAKEEDIEFAYRKGLRFLEYKRLV